MDVLVVQHQDLGGPEAFGAALEAEGARLDIRNAEQGQDLPADGGGHAALLVLGGVMNANQDGRYPHLPETVALIQEFHGQAKPVIGICLGSQLVARALGGRVYRHGAPELGFVPLSLTGAAAADPLLAGLDSPQCIMEWHEDTFDMPAGARLLATSETCRNQIFRLGEGTYGFQCHFEVTRALVEGWTADPSNLSDDDAHADFLARIDGELTRHMDASLAFCRTVAARWTRLIAARRAA